jgi:glycerol kinase
LVCIGITNQRETSVIWDSETLRSPVNAIVWQCRRTADECERLKQEGYEDLVRAKTGLVLDPYFSATKLGLLAAGPEARALRASNHLKLGTIDSWLIARLSGGKTHVTDVSNASRTSLYNIHLGEWDEELCTLFQVPMELLPGVKPSSGVMATTLGLEWLPDGIPISGVAGDQQAALFGQGCFEPGQAKCTFGTGSFILMNTGTEAVQSSTGMLTTIAWQLEAKAPAYYALEGGAFLCGAAVDWVRDSLGIIQSAQDIETLANTVESSEGVDFVPALTGLGAPHWAPTARGLITGLSRGTHAGHIARATLDAMALQNADILAAMVADCDLSLRDLRVDGGACANNLLMQIQSDLLGRSLLRPLQIETTAIGACYLAGIGVGLWRDASHVGSLWKEERRFEPIWSDQQRAQRNAQWRAATAQTLSRL